jgi:hypothetical protein
MKITLADLIAGRPIPSPTDPEQGIAVPPIAAAALMVAVARDQYDMSLHLLPVPAQMSVAAEADPGQDSYVDVRVGHRSLRYALDVDPAARIWAPDLVLPLCQLVGCPGPAIANGHLTRFCDDHIQRCPETADALRQEAAEAASKAASDYPDPTAFAS